MKSIGFAKETLRMEFYRDWGEVALGLAKINYLEKIVDLLDMNKAKKLTTLRKHFKLFADLFPKKRAT